MKKTVVIGMLGTVVDQPVYPSRWTRWRPTVSIGQHEELLVSRLELIHDGAYRELAEVVAGDLRTVSPETDVRLHRLDFEDAWDFESVYEGLVNFAKNYPFDTEREDYLVHITTGTHVMQICLFLLVESRIIPARILQTYAAKDRRSVTGRYVIIDLDLSRYDRLAERFKTERTEGIHYLKSGIATRNPVFNRLIEQIARVSAGSDAPILLTGPSGVGKTRMARLIYEWKKKNHRVTGRFVELNCATLQGAAAMSALFGHVKGAYTGAVDKRSGMLAAADGGLLFLDEVAELGADEQAMLLRALEEKRFYPMGSDHEVQSNFQLICGTNRDLRAMSRDGSFRPDLLARICLWTFRMPGLAERPEDIEPNLRYELDRASEQLEHVVRMNREAEALFLRNAMAPDALWKANFRDLAGAVTRMAVLSEGGRITEPLVREEWQRLRSDWGDAADDGRRPDADTVREVLGDKTDALDLFDIPQLALVIRVCRESASASEAGRRLFARSMLERRSTNDSDRLRKYLARFGLSWKAVREAGGATPG